VGQVKAQLSKTHTTNLEQLKEDILKLWLRRIDNSSYLKELVESIPQQLQEVIDRGRNVTHYK
jgi:hypothetical protein